MTTKVIQADREAAAAYVAVAFGERYRKSVLDEDRWPDLTLAFASHADPLRRALEKIAEGDEPRPVGKFWFADERPSKHDQCTHGVWMYETCGNCIADFARAALSSGENNNGE